MWSKWRHRIATRSAEPTKPNQNGAVIPNVWASRPPIGGADHQAADDRDPVDAGHPAEQLVGDGPLADDGRRRAPDELVGPEDDQRGERDRRRRREGEGQVGDGLDEQARRA